MTNKRFVYSLFIALTSVWLGWTVLVDFFIVPTVFQKVSSFFEAGELGIATFSKLNNLELIVASMLVVITGHLALKKRTFPLFSMAVILWIIVMFYFIYLTPKIAHLTLIWRESEKLGLSGIGGISDIQQEHQFYHKLYIYIDSLKILILSCLLTYGTFKDTK